MGSNSEKNLTSPEWFHELRSETIHLRPVRSEDAEYIFSLRTDERYNQHLSPPPNSTAEQAAWISHYLAREQRGSEYYFVIWNNKGCRCGTVRLYDMRQNSFCWGSWILDSNKTRYAAIESALLVYRIGFDFLGFAQSHFDVRIDNTNVIKFHKRMGAQITNKDTENVFMILPQAAFVAHKEKLVQLVRRRRSE